MPVPYREINVKELNPYERRIEVVLESKEKVAFKIKNPSTPNQSMVYLMRTILNRDNINNMARAEDYIRYLGL